MVTHEIMTVLFSHVLLFPILAHECSNLFPDIKRWHLSELFSIEYFSYLIRTIPKFLPQPTGVASLAKLHT